MTTASNVEGIRLAYVHLSVTTPRAPVRHQVPAEVTPVARDADHRRWDRAAATGSAERTRGLAA